MSTPLQDLWDEVVPLEGPCPAPRPGEVARRVNAALDAVPSERKRHMRQKWRTAVILAAALLALAGSALAVARNWTVLDAFFGGSSQTGEALMDTTAYSVSDDNYTLTVTSSVSDGSTAYLTVTVEAKTTEAVETLMADDFENMDTWSVSFPEPEEEPEEGTAEAISASFGTSEAESLRTDTSRTWSLELIVGSGTPQTISLRLNAMEEGLKLEVPLTLAQSVTVTVGAEGTGAGTLYHAAGGPVTLESVTLSPLGLTLDYTYPADSGQSWPVVAFLGTDGTLYTWSQLVSDLSQGGTSQQEGETVTASMDYSFRAVQDLSQLEAVVFEGRAYPLDGGDPYEVDVSGLPEPFKLTLMDRLTEDGGYALPVRALCDALGATCEWDENSRSASMTFRGVTIVLTEGETTALVNGKTVELAEAPAIQDGSLAADCDIFVEYWLLDMYAAMEDWSAGLTDRVAWIVVP